MAKSKANGSSEHRGSSRKRTTSRAKKETRVILFPTEPTTIPEEELKRAVERVIAARKK